MSLPLDDALRCIAGSHTAKARPGVTGLRDVPPCKATADGILHHLPSSLGSSADGQS